LRSEQIEIALDDRLRGLPKIDKAVEAGQAELETMLAQMIAAEGSGQ
jgi:hypothetical protein